MLPALALEAADSTAVLVSNKVDKAAEEIPRETVKFPEDTCNPEVTLASEDPMSISVAVVFSEVESRTVSL